MALQQIDVFKRVPFDGNPSGYYYWSSVYYYDRSDFTSDFNLRVRVSAVDRFCLIPNAEVVKMVVKEPPGRNNVIFTSGPLSQPGTLPITVTDYRLIDVARVITEFADGTRSYRYVRPPMPEQWIVGEWLTSEALMWIGGYFGAMRAVSGFPPSRNLNGSPLQTAYLPMTVSKWQLRHGTKRRQRST